MEHTPTEIEVLQGIGREIRKGNAHLAVIKGILIVMLLSSVLAFIVVWGEAA